MKPRRDLLPIMTLAAAALGSESCSARAIVVNRAYDIEVVVKSGVKNAPDNRIAIVFDAQKAETFTIDLRVRNFDGSTRTSFTGWDAWVRLSVDPGTIVETVGGGGPADTSVAGPNVHLTSGEAKGVTVKVKGAYGDARLIAQNVGFVPAPPGKTAQCADGIDNDRNGFADYPHDPNCIFLNDDSEAPFEPAYGVSPVIYYRYPRIHDVTAGSVSPFVNQQVDIPADAFKMVVTNVTTDGMYVADLEDERGGELGLGNSVFIYNYSPPYAVRPCDRITRLAGNVSDFFGFTEIGTPGWTNVLWISEERSGPCPLKRFAEVTPAIRAKDDVMRGLSGALISLTRPRIGNHFGPGLVKNAAPSADASNCDLNGDGIVGWNPKKPGYRDDERACNDACQRDPDCTEWNNYVGRGQFKIRFGDGGEAPVGTMFMTTSAIPGFDARKFVSADASDQKLESIRGTMRIFLGPTPPYTVQPRCEDDIVFAGYTPKDAGTACVRPRYGADAE